MNAIALVIPSPFPDEWTADTAIALASAARSSGLAELRRLAAGARRRTKAMRGPEAEARRWGERLRQVIQAPLATIFEGIIDVLLSLERGGQAVRLKLHALAKQNEASAREHADWTSSDPNKGDRQCPTRSRPHPPTP